MLAAFSGAVLRSARSRVAFAPAAVRALASSGPVTPIDPPSPGGAAGEIPENENQATGMERQELLYLKENKKLWDDVIVGPKGTKENPVVVESVFDERVVGCPANCDDPSHESGELIWFTLKAGESHTCGLCGQVFVLKKMAE